MQKLNLSRVELDELLTDKWDGKEFEDDPPRPYGIQGKFYGYRLTRTGEVYWLRFFDGDRYDLIGDFVLEFQLIEDGGDFLMISHRIRPSWFLLAVNLAFAVFLALVFKNSVAFLLLAIGLLIQFSFWKNLDPASFIQFLESKTSIRPAKKAWWNF